MIHSAQISKKAFTLIELLIVISILAITTGVMLPSYLNYLRQRNFINGFVAIRQTLIDVQNRALTGVGTDTGMRYWIVNFNSGYMYIDASATLDAAACTSAVSSPIDKVIYPSGMSVNVSNNYCIFFGTSSSLTYVYDGSAMRQNSSYTINISNPNSSRNLNLTHAGVVF